MNLIKKYKRKNKGKKWDRVIESPVAKHSDLAGNAGRHEIKTKYKRKRKHKETIDFHFD